MSGKRLRAKSVTRRLFVTTQLAALAWVSASYLIAIYSTVALEQPFPVVELSQQAITTHHHHTGRQRPEGGGEHL